jgi:hypothetical protein
MRTFTSGLFHSHAKARALLLVLTSLFAFLCGASLRADQTTQLVLGSTITLSVSSNGTPPFSYQWRKNGANIPGANSASLALSNVSAADAGNYSVIVSNSAGSTTSDLAIVTAPSIPVIPPAILTQPSSQTVIPDGEDGVLLSVTASGSVPLTYQWKKNGADIPSATESSLSIDPVAAVDFGNYTVVVSNSAGSVESNPAQITDATIPPSFSSQLIGQTVTTGSTVTFSLVAGGTAPLSYQWRINGTNLANSAVVSGATSPTLTLTGVTPTYSALYSVIATNSAGSVSSNSATLLVNDPPPVVPPTPPTPENPNPPPVSQDVAPAFTTQPISREAAIGEVVSFSASVSARPNATYRWQKDGIDLFSVGTVSGADTPVLTLFGVRTTDAGTYRLIATNSVAATTSSPATLVVKSIQVPTIITQPVAQQANVGSVAFFTVAVSAFPAPTYQWRKNGVNLSNGGNITGANRPTLAVSNLASSDAGTYSVVITNEAGSATSNNAALSTDGTPVFTGQPMITSQPPPTTVASAGSIVQLAVTVAGDPVPTVQWRRDGIPLTNGGIVSGATSTILTLTGVTTADAGAYSVVATNSLGSVTSSSFNLSVQAGNVWNQPVTSGKDVALSSPGASGNIQWQISTNSGATWTNLAADSTYSGVTTNTLHIANASPSLNTALFRLVTVADGETTVLHSARLNVVNAFVPFPVALAADALGNLYVADANNDTIGKINVASQIVTLAGTAGQTGTADGTGSAARFNDPSGVAAASDGTLAVADKANGTIRVISPSGAVSTLRLDHPAWQCRWHRHQRHLFLAQQHFARFRRQSLRGRLDEPYDPQGDSGRRRDDPGRCRRTGRHQRWHGQRRTFQQPHRHRSGRWRQPLRGRHRQQPYPQGVSNRRRDYRRRPGWRHRHHRRRGQPRSLQSACRRGRGQ